ncbi:MAG: class I SAM-dependent methyltransferase [Polyangiaceae bacterium]
MSQRRPHETQATYEDYDSTSANYDEHRKPLGVGVIVGILAGGGVALERARLLDAGCGTGSYLAALAHRFAELEGLEISRGMLGRARTKLAKHRNVRLHEGSVLDMPLDAQRFDAVLFNQVIHHLDDLAGAATPNLRKALAEAHRVLRDGGAVVINTCSQEQVFEGAWYTRLIPEAVERLARRYVPIAKLRELLEELGFEVGEEIVPLGERFSGPDYLDPRGPLEKSFRDSDSLWALATPEELDRGLAELRAMIERGEAEAFVAQRDREQRAIGQATFLPAWKRGAARGAL